MYHNGIEESSNETVSPGVLEGQNVQACDNLLDSAEKLFANVGFDAASVRSITKTAGCNIASVNYHFGSKDNLYVEVWRRRLPQLRDIRVNAINELMSRDGNVTLEELLEAFAQAFLMPFMDETSGSTLMNMMVREMNDPHLPKNVLFNELFYPVVETLKSAIMKICPWLDDQQAFDCIFSVVGQLIHVLQYDQFVSRVDAKDIMPFEIGQGVKHVVRFSAAAIRAGFKEGSDNE